MKELYLLSPGSTSKGDTAHSRTTCVYVTCLETSKPNDANRSAFQNPGLLTTHTTSGGGVQTPRAASGRSRPPADWIALVPRTASRHRGRSLCAKPGDARRGMYKLHEPLPPKKKRLVILGHFLCQPGNPSRGLSSFPTAPRILVLVARDTSGRLEDTGDGRKVAIPAEMAKAGTKLLSNSDLREKVQHLDHASQDFPPQKTSGSVSGRSEFQASILVLAVPTRLRRLGFLLIPPRPF